MSTSKPHAAPPPAPPRGDPDSPSPRRQSIIDLLNRSDAERSREHRYRFAQAAVFGLPALALQWLGPALGGREGVRWIGAFQAILVGWAVYVGAAGMLVEGLLLPRRRSTADAVVAAIVVGLYLLSALSALAIVITGHASLRPRFHFVIILLVAWTGLRWRWLEWRIRRASPPPPPPTGTFKR